MRRAPALLVLLLAACERTAPVPSCDGAVQARLVLRAALSGGAACAAAARVPEAPGVTVLVSYPGPTSATVCPERELAPPLEGARDGDQLVVVAPARAAGVLGCACAVDVVERVTGTLARDGAGAATGFAGELVNDFLPADGSTSCAATAGASCPVPCRVSWTLAAP